MAINRKQQQWNTLTQLTKGECAVWNHLVEYTFLYSKTDDKGKFKRRVLNYLVNKGVIHITRDHDDPGVYELTDLYYSDARDIGLLDCKQAR